MKVFENIKYGPADEQALDLYIPDAEEFPVFVYLHGGGFENGSKKMDFIPALCEKGVAVVSGEYRKYPNGAKYPEFLEDAASVVAWAKKNVGGSQYGKVTHFYVGGSSAGGYATMMLCFNPAYLAAHGLSNADIDAYYHDAGQPTAHFNVLKERGIDERRIIVDESAPLYYVDETPYPPMELVVSEHDISNRYEQIQLLMGTLRHFGHDMSKVFYTYKEGWHHCKYMYEPGDHGNWIFADMIYEFIERMEKLYGIK
ncbi:MAG: alpha/beta hydrolase [Firmicutes bacterium]|nr:alpha/beta hydrolase [Bacillota bacterium]